MPPLGAIFGPQAQRPFTRAATFGPQGRLLAPRCLARKGKSYLTPFAFPFAPPVFRGFFPGLFLGVFFIDPKKTLSIPVYTLHAILELFFNPLEMNILTPYNTHMLRGLRDLGQAAGAWPNRFLARLILTHSDLHVLMPMSDVDA